MTATPPLPLQRHRSPRARLPRRETGDHAEVYPLAQCHGLRLQPEEQPRAGAGMEPAPSATPACANWRGGHGGGLDVGAPALRTHRPGARHHAARRSGRADAARPQTVNGSSCAASAWPISPARRSAGDAGAPVPANRRWCCAWRGPASARTAGPTCCAAPSMPPRPPRRPPPRPPPRARPAHSTNWSGAWRSWSRRWTRLLAHLPGVEPGDATGAPAPTRSHPWPPTRSVFSSAACRPQSINRLLARADAPGAAGAGASARSPSGLPLYKAPTTRRTSRPRGAGAQGRPGRRRRGAVRHARVQPLHSGRAEERHRWPAAPAATPSRRPRR